MGDEKLIVVTGFDIFSGHEEKNASIEAVKLLKNEIEVDKQKFIIKKILVEVKYDDVDKKVEDIWKMNPHLVIHVGVSKFAQRITLEKCAFNGFHSQDYACKTIDPIVCLDKSGKCQRLETEIDVVKMTRCLNENYKGMFETSCDPGKYLCCYIYLKSLDIDPSKTLFIHVPCIDKPYNSQETSDAVSKVIEYLITS